MRAFLIFSTLPLLAAGALAQHNIVPDEKLAPYLPSPQVVVEKMLELAHLKPDELVYDLGCGDGRVVITAAQKYGARAVGVEIDEALYKSCVRRVADLGLESRVRIVHGNALTVDLSDADVVTMYLLTSSNKRLKPILDRMKPGARVVSYAFEVPGWEAARVLAFTSSRVDHTLYVYEIASKRAARPVPSGVKKALR